jgi:hypothetical protein
MAQPPSSRKSFAIVQALFRKFILRTAPTSHPRWYNTITTDCSTAIRDRHPSAERTPWDWHILLNGKGDERL